MSAPTKTIDWGLLEKLRGRFLAEEAGGGDYWASSAELEAYDATFAQRIGWKWAAVLSEVHRRGWRPGPKALTLLDWGCGTGIATRCWLSFWRDAGAGGAINRVRLCDRSARARTFAAATVQTLAPELAVVGDNQLPASGEPFVLLLSHVLSELDTPTIEALIPLLEASEAFFWVEPGTPALSRRLIAIRERLRETKALVAPCPHQASCGLLTPRNESHWCHHFAEPPPEVFQSALWEEFSRRLHIDRRSLPVSYLMAARRGAVSLEPREERVLGRPRLYKGYATALVCDEKGVAERKWLKREHPGLLKRWERPGFDPATGE